jgi:hypothetical protein
MRLAYLGVANVFALLRPLPMSSRDKDAEILVLRHQLLVVQPQLGPDRVRFTAPDRALLAALLHGLPENVLRRLHLVVRPGTVLRSLIWSRAGMAAGRDLGTRAGGGPCARSASGCSGWSARTQDGDTAGCMASSERDRS